MEDSCGYTVSMKLRSVLLKVIIPIINTAIILDGYGRRMDNL